VKGLTDLMGAAISARSEGLGHGAEFRVAFQPSGPPEARPAPAPASAPRRLRILVVDDNADVRDTLVEYLASLRGHEVAAAEDAEAGLERAVAFRPQVVFCDLGLPRLSGHEFARRARQGEALREAVLVALTGYGTDADKLRSAQAGFDHHLTKPLDLDELDRFLVEVGARGREAATLRRG
jgi:CheY-like chemotaxis protein